LPTVEPDIGFEKTVLQAKQLQGRDAIGKLDLGTLAYAPAALDVLNDPN
jgi:hypothetical protein